MFNWDYYAKHPNKILAIWEGGLAIHGVLIGAVLTILVFAKVRNISFWKLTDILAPSLILGQAIGRWGNFINQEAHGGPVSREFLENLYLPDFIKMALIKYKRIHTYATCLKKVESRDDPAFHHLILKSTSDYYDWMCFFN